MVAYAAEMRGRAMDNKYVWFVGGILVGMFVVPKLSSLTAKK